MAYSSPHLSAIPQRLSFTSKPSPAHLNSRSVGVRVKSSLENESCTPGVSNDSLEPAQKKGTQVSTSRRLCLTCICSSLALISSAGTAVSLANAMAMDEKEKAVCRNCGGSGAVL